jgi:prepilin-type N-terminal cleavage/methylation domain-containing protein
MMRNRRPKAAAAGFTLIELMLALSILAVILAMIAGSFNVVAHGKTHAEGRLWANQAGQSIIWMMSQEIRGAVRTLPNQPPNHMLMIGGGHMGNRAPLDSLTLATMGGGHHRALFGFGAEDVVSYSAQPNPDHRGWFLLMRSQQSALLPPGVGGQGAPVALADNVLELHLRYFDGQIWNESWKSTAQENMPLPVAVSIDLMLADANGRPLNFSTQVAVPMAMLQR